MARQAGKSIMHVLDGFEPIGTTVGKNKELYIELKEDDFENVISSFSREGLILISLFCAQDFDAGKRFTLFYVFEKHGYSEILVLKRGLKENDTSSISMIFPAACWYEREIMDGFGISFDNSYDKRRLFLHEPYPTDFHPLLKSVPNKPLTFKKAIEKKDEYEFRKIEGEGVYQIPVGPVHAGIIEPCHFRFSVIGETIFNLETRFFYKHRGIEKIAENKTPDECVKIAEAISGDETVANAVCFCNAVEKISGIKLPKGAECLRALYMELERIYSLLSDIAGMLTDVAYPVGASEFFVLREEIFRQNEALTGSRFMKGAIRVGGVKSDVSAKGLKELERYLDIFSKRFVEAKKEILESSLIADRFETTGIVKKDLVAALNITGPIARASGIYTDTRIDHSYGIYPELNLPKRTITTGNGDVSARFIAKSSEIITSVSIIRTLIKRMPKGEVAKIGIIKDGYALSLVESARGQNLQWVNIRNGLIDRYKIRTASFCNWQAIEHTVPGNIVPDFPLINKSFNLSYAGTDL